MRATVPNDIKLGQLEELALLWGLNAIYDADNQTLHLSEEDWISEADQHALELPVAA